MFAYVPARGGSKRIPRKNLRELDGVPIIGRVLRTLAELPFIDRVHVSTDDDEIRELAEAYGAECLKPRAPALADSQSGFIDLIRDDIPRFVEANDDDSQVLFALATAALLPASIYAEAYEVYCRDNPDVLMSCEPFPEPAWWALTQKDDGFWYPVFPDKVLINSQDLPPTITDSGLFYMFDQKVLSRFPSHKAPDRLQAFIAPHEYRCDVNDEEDWERLEWKYERLKRRRARGETC